MSSKYKVNDALNVYSDSGQHVCPFGGFYPSLNLFDYNNYEISSGPNMLITGQLEFYIDRLADGFFVFS